MQDDRQETSRRWIVILNFVLVYGFEIYRIVFLFYCRKSVLCKYYMHGACNRGENCPFSHDLSDAPNHVRLLLR